MKKQIRDIDIIEKELNSNFIGVLALSLEHESVIQKPVRYLYHDKNLYFYFKEEDDLVNKIPFGALVSFTVIKESKPRKTESDQSFRCISIAVSGSIKFVDDTKLVEELQKSYEKKYKYTQNDIFKILMIDTEEFHAHEHTGG